MQHETADSGSKTLLSLEIDNLSRNKAVDQKFWKEHEIDLHLPRKKIIHKDVSEIDDYVPKFKEHIKYSLKISGSQDDFNALRQAFSRLKLSDSSLQFEEEQSSVLGRGFRSGFLGMLHLEIITERLRREFSLDPLLIAKLS